MKKLRIVFFGTPEYSLLVLEPLTQTYDVVAVVTKPPSPLGRKKILTPTPVAVWAKNNHIPLLTPETDPTNSWRYADETALTEKILEYQPEILVVANYAQKVPMSLVTKIKYGGLNVHPSLLPNYRGPAPVPWAIYNGETETGVTIVTLAEEFDAGEIVAQARESILPTDTMHTLLTRLFEKGALLLLDTLERYYSPTPSNSLFKRGRTVPSLSKGGLGRVGGKTEVSYTPRLTREHGFEPWEHITQAMTDGTEAERIERKWRAFHPWPGLWTKVKLDGQEKRLKLLQVHTSTNYELRTKNLILDELQLEGKAPVTGKAVEELLSRIQG